MLGYSISYLSKGESVQKFENGFGYLSLTQKITLPAQERTPLVICIYFPLYGGFLYVDVFSVGFTPNPSRTATQIPYEFINCCISQNGGGGGRSTVAPPTFLQQNRYF